MDEYEDGDSSDQPKQSKKGNILPLWGNSKTMNMNPLILTNIQSSHYFKVNLYELKTYHEVIDEIYYKVSHLEPWEKGSRKTAGQTGMCGGVRGVGAGGIVSTAYCLLYKLFTLRLTRKQLNGLINHTDSPYIRALGFMYIRYTQPPADLYDWYDEYLEDGEEVDVKAGGGQVMTMGDVLKAFLTKLEWFSTLFPRIPVPIQQSIESKMNERFPAVQQQQQQRPVRDVRYSTEPTQDKYTRNGGRSNEKWNERGPERWNDRGGGGGGGSSYRDRSPVQDRQRHRDRDREDHRESSRRDRHDSFRDRHSHRDRERDHRHRDVRDVRNRPHHHHR